MEGRHGKRQRRRKRGGENGGDRKGELQRGLVERRDGWRRELGMDGQAKRRIKKGRDVKYEWFRRTEGKLVDVDEK